MATRTTLRRRQKVQELIETPTTVEERIDLYGALQRDVVGLNCQMDVLVKPLGDKITEKVIKMAKLREEIEKEATADLGDQQKTTVVGRFYAATIGKCKKNRKIIDMAKIHAFVESAKVGAFFELCTFPLGKVDDYLTPPQRAEVLEENHNGSRNFKVESRSLDG